MSNNLLLNFPRRTCRVIINQVHRRFMPVNVPPTVTGKRRFRHAVETDPHKLVNYCCGLNYHIDEPPVKLKPDNEYPDWLWELRLEPEPHSWEMEKGTKEYYYKLAQEGKAMNFILKEKGQQKSKVVGKVLKDQMEYMHRLRFAVLAYMEEDAGLDSNSSELDWLKRNHQFINKREYYLPVNENKVLYKDKIEGNIKTKNFKYDDESTFIRHRGVDTKRILNSEAIQDSKRRHKHSVM